MIKALTLDLDDTLWDIWATIERAEQGLHQWLERHHPEIPQAYSPLELRQLANQAATQWPELAHDRSALRKRGLAWAAELSGCDNFSAEQAFEVFYAGRNDVYFFADAIPALQALSRHYPLIALTNGNADLNAIGIAQYFQAVYSSSDVGFSKPDARMFQLACDKLNLSAPEICHIGDDPALDVAGAANVGMRTVWVNRQEQIYPADLPPADGQVASLEQLLPWLEGL